MAGVTEAEGFVELGLWQMPGIYWRLFLRMRGVLAVLRVRLVCCNPFWLAIL